MTAGMRIGNVQNKPGRRAGGTHRRGAQRASTFDCDAKEGWQSVAKECDPVEVAHGSVWRGCGDSSRLRRAGGRVSLSVKACARVPVCA